VLNKLTNENKSFAVKQTFFQTKAV